MISKRIIIIISLLFISLTTNAQQAYYNDVDLLKNKLALKDELATKIISTHKKFLSYSEIWNVCKIVDVNPKNPNEVILVYGYSDSGKTSRTRFINANGGGSTDWNREHTYPKSLGTPNLKTSGPGADSHHLRPADVLFNSLRSSKKFTSGSGNAGDRSGGWYPGDEWKGDIARMMMYMYLRYGDQCLPTNVVNGTKNSTDANMINLLLDWNAEDPVSEIEKKRNEYHDSNATYAQGNRNPFIDNPYLATRIWGGKKAQDLWNNDNEEPAIVINPPSNLIVSVTKNSAEVSWNPSTTKNVIYKVYLDNGDSITTTKTSYLFTGLKAKKYTIYIVAQDTKGNQSKKLYKSFTVDTPDDVVIPPNTGKNCGYEDFENISGSFSSYSKRVWEGNYSSWTAENSRTDLKLTNKAITLGKGTTSKLVSGIINNGISSLTINTKRVFSGNSGTYNLYINDQFIALIPYSDKLQEITIDNINIPGNFNIKISNNSSIKNRVSFDNLKWKCYTTASINNYKKSKELIKIYPNPCKTGKVTIENFSGFKIKSLEIYSLLGNLIYRDTKNISLKNRSVIKNLNKGVYLLVLKNNYIKLSKKLIIQ